MQDLVVSSPKVAGLTVISRELADDSNPAAAQVVGQGLARDIARRIDQAAFAGLASPAPAGLSTLSGVQTYVSASAFANLDFAAQAISKAETVGATVTAFVTSPATALALGTIKQATGSNQPVLGTDATSATSRQILGVPLYVSQYVASNTRGRSTCHVSGLSYVTKPRSRPTEAFFHQRPGCGQGDDAGRVRLHPPQSVVKVTTA